MTTVPTHPLPQRPPLFHRIDDHTDPWRDPEVIVFVNGFAETTEAWRTWIPHFSRRYRVVRYDQRGFGQSGAVETDFDFSTAMLAEDLAGLVEAVSPGRPVHLVSAKSGGIPAASVAMDRPELVRSLTMVSPALKGPDTTGWAECLAQGGMPAWARWTMGTRMGSMPAAGIDWWVDMMGRTAASTAVAYLRWVGKVDLHGELGRVACPALIVGNESARRGLAEFRELQSRMPLGELAVIETDGYHTGAVAPDACAEATLAFLSRNPA